MVTPISSHVKDKNSTFTMRSEDMTFSRKEKSWYFISIYIITHNEQHLSYFTGIVMLLIHYNCVLGVFSNNICQLILEYSVEHLVLNSTSEDILFSMKFNLLQFYCN